MSVLALLLACAHPQPSPPAPRGVEVRFRPVATPPAEAGPLLEANASAVWDAGLAAAAQEVAAMSGRSTRIDPVAAAAAAARAGFPGPARFARYLSGGPLPAEALAALAAVPGVVDVGLARRTWGDGVTLWILAWAPHKVDIDPLPRDLRLDEGLAVRVDAVGVGEARLYVAPPDGPVAELSLTPGTPRWVDAFHVPGAYRVEVVTERAGVGDVALLFTVYVETPPPAPAPMPPAAPRAPQSPIAAEAEVYAALNALRLAHGLPRVERFVPFESLAREHSALMASEDVLGHVIPGVTNGVAERAAAQFHPGARHREDVAAAPTAAEALALIVDSPGHLANLLCGPCTHASVGVALEPVLDRPPRLFLTVELLEFNQGIPQPLERMNRALPGGRP